MQHRSTPERGGSIRVVPTSKKRLMLNLEPQDEEALAAVTSQVPNMAKARVALSALRLGLAELRRNPDRAASVPPGGPPDDPKRKK